MRSLALASFLSWLVAPGFAAQESAPPAAFDLRVMSFNTRYYNDTDRSDRWEFRRHLVLSTLRFHRADVVGLQETGLEQLADIAEALPEYRAFGAGRDGGRAGEHCTILYDERRLSLAREDTFWLSPTPHVPGPAWGAKLSRICTWGELVERATGRSVFVFNTHFDHQSRRARRESAELLVQRMREIAGEAPVVLLGDLNCPEWGPPLQMLFHGRGDEAPEPGTTLALRDARSVAHEPAHGPTGTISGFGNSSRYVQRIDFILVAGAIEVERHAVLGDHVDGRTPSDHRPILADLRVGAAYDPTVLQFPSAWKFRTDPEDEGHAAGWGAPGLDARASDWRDVRTGDSWERQGFRDYDGVAWYRRWVEIPAAWSDATVQLELGGVDDAYTLFLNGEELLQVGSAQDSQWTRRDVVHLPARALRMGRANLIAFRVEDYDGEGGITGTPPALHTDLVATTREPAGFDRRLIQRREFRLAAQERETLTLRVPAAVPDRCWLRVGLHPTEGGVLAGVRWRLLDAAGEPVLEGLARAHGTTWIEPRAVPGSVWELELSGSGTGVAGTVEARAKTERTPEPPGAHKPRRRPKGAPPEAVAFGGNWYWFPEERMTFDAALREAEERRGKLVTISSLAENDFVQGHARGSTFLGLSREGTDWKPLDADAPPFFLWDIGEPNNSRDELHACLFSVNGFWHDHLKSEQRFACVEWGDEED